MENNVGISSYTECYFTLLHSMGAIKNLNLPLTNSLQCSGLESDELPSKSIKLIYILKDILKQGISTGYLLIIWPNKC